METNHPPAAQESGWDDDNWEGDKDWGDMDVSIGIKLPWVCGFSVIKVSSFPSRESQQHTCQLLWFTCKSYGFSEILWSYHHRRDILYGSVHFE